TSTARLEAAGLSEQGYKGIRNANGEVLRRFSARKYTFVGLGRSLTYNIAFLQNLNPDIAFNLPLSGLRTASVEKLERVYFDHFRRVLPDQLFLSRKTILLMDGVLKGNSLAKGAALLRKYIESRGFKTKLETLAFIDDSEGDQAIVKHGFQALDMRKHPDS